MLITHKSLKIILHYLKVKKKVQKTLIQNNKLSNRP